MIRAKSLTVFALLLLVPVLAQAEEWGWQTTFTSTSSKDLIALHGRLLSQNALSGVQGVPVEDLTWKDQGIEIHMIDGVVFVEPGIEGYPVGAYFKGEATISYVPSDRRPRREMTRYFGKETIEKEPIDFVYFFTLREKNLLEQIGAGGEGSVLYQQDPDYELSKRSLRQMGTEILADFLNRDGLCKNAAYVVFAPPSIRETGSKQALLLYSYNPADEHEIHLHAFGHEHVVPGGTPTKRALDALPEYKYYYRPLVFEHSNPRAFVQQGVVEEYATELGLRGTKDTDAVSTVTFTPSEGVNVLRLELTPRLKVDSVTGPDGQTLPHVQWSWTSQKLNFDQHLLVLTGDDLVPGQTQKITVTSSGPLFDAAGAYNYLVDEDTWHPRLNDPGSAMFDLKVTVPKKHNAVGTGELVSLEEVDGGKQYHYRTTRPHKRSTFYYGDYRIKETKADDTTIEVFANWDTKVSDLKYAVTEFSNILKVYNRILCPIGLDHLRVAGTPTWHGRGFEGLILVGEWAGFNSDSHGADLFRAHEVAHQWWGNMVQPKNWPEDRWLSEAFAEYTAMEYFSLRFEKPAKTRELMRQEWALRLIHGDYDLKAQTLDGEKSRLAVSQMDALVDGGQNVYSKGPLVLNSLRYLFEVQKKSDEGFWTLLQDFLEKYKYQRASTKDFMQLTEQHMGGRLDWFWDQWIYGTAIPAVVWDYDVQQVEGGDYLLTVTAEQVDTEFVMAIPVYVHVKGGEPMSTPLIMRGKTGQAKVKLRSKPSDVTINDNYEALIRQKRS